MPCAFSKGHQDLQSFDSVKIVGLSSLLLLRLRRSYKQEMKMSSGQDAFKKPIVFVLATFDAFGTGISCQGKCQAKKRIKCHKVA
jgi:hypothetical protein